MFKRHLHTLHSLREAARRNEPVQARGSPRILEVAKLDIDGVLRRFATRREGLASAEAHLRLKQVGPNELAKDVPKSVAVLLWHAILNPLVVLLAVLAITSLLTGDLGAAVMMLLMICLGVGLKLIQEARAENAASKLKAMLTLRATVRRNDKLHELDLARLVPGDIVELAAGDMVPGDVRIIAAKDLFVAESLLTGESFPVEKFEVEKQVEATGLTPDCIAFLGTSVQSGSATAVIIATGKNTYLGQLAHTLTEEPEMTAFDRGIAKFTWLMLRFISVMVPLVFVINLVTKHNATSAFFFALAVAVGLTPEMLPMIVSVCLSRGALGMSRKKVIVKRLGAIQDLGAMDVLCTDKTGTLTLDRVILERHCDVALQESDAVLALAYMNSHFQTGLRNVLDRAILAHTATHDHAKIPEYAKVDEIPFDFERRLMSVVVRTPEGKDRIITKGAPEALFPRCANFQLDGQLYPMDHAHIAGVQKEYEKLSAQGFRVLAIASKDVDPLGVVAGDATPYSKADEHDLTLSGYTAFFDPPKDTAAAAITALQSHGVVVKLVTGDNDLVARKICHEVGLNVEHALLGHEIEGMSDQQLAAAAERTTLFARVSPSHKQRIIRALQSHGHAVGFMGDGINDAAALHTADVGISVDNAVNVAKGSADLILLEKSLLVLEAGVVEGRKVFANILKYVRMGASSNFGNMLSMVGASVFVPFLPMTPIQILANNLLYDVSQTAIPTDDVDPDQLEKPRPWNIADLIRYIVVIGPCSSIFDYTTYFVMLYVFHCWDVSTPERAAYSASLFQSGWFVESLLTQTLIIHIIRTRKIPFLQSRPSWPLLMTSLIVVLVGISLPYSGLGRYMGLVPLPPLYWPLLAATIACYAALTQAMKMWLERARAASVP